jgi:hypothetical protein
MAVWDSATIKADTSSHGLLSGRLEAPRADSSRVEPDVGGKWHPAATLAFIVASCGLLWAGIFAVIAAL